MNDPYSKTIDNSTTPPTCKNSLQVDSSSTDLETTTTTNSQYPTTSHSHDKTEDQQNDYVYARNTMRNLIKDGQHIVNNLVEEIQDHEAKPRHFEVASSLMKNISEISKDLINLHSQINDIENKSNNSENKNQNINFQNNTYYSTTKEIIDNLNNDDSHDSN
jgi:hypothetical protein